MNIYDHEVTSESEMETSLPLGDSAKPIPRSIPGPIASTGDVESSIGSRPLIDRPSSTGQIDDSELPSPTKRRRLTGSTSYQASPTSLGSLNLVQSPASSWQGDIHTGWTPANIENYESLSFETPLPAVEQSSPQSHHTHQISFPTLTGSLSRIYLETPIWPLTNREEAWLLRYYVEHVSRNFDLQDQHRHFRTVVPQRASTCPTLLNAIYALSARHLSRIGEYDPLISNKYHQECLKHLIPMLDDSAAILDENLFASTIILRHLEEIEVPLSGQSPSDKSSHLLGAHALISAQERATTSGGLREAAFWTGLRQEIYVAFVNQRSIMPSLDNWNIDRSFDAADDFTWSRRMVVICSDTLQYCFGDNDSSTAIYNWLVESASKWHDSKPASFTPIYYREADDERVFPDIWYVGDEIVVGWQHYHIAQILLASHNPKMPRLGPSRAAALKAMDEEIKSHVRVLCGIAMVCYPPVLVENNIELIDRAEQSGYRTKFHVSSIHSSKCHVHC